VASSKSNDEIRRAVTSLDKVGYELYSIVYHAIHNFGNYTQHKNGLVNAFVASKTFKIFN